MLMRSLHFPHFPILSISGHAPIPTVFRLPNPTLNTSRVFYFLSHNRLPPSPPLPSLSSPPQHNPETMSVQSEVIDQWRGFFQSSSADIFEIIERAIVVAAEDCPSELKSRRTRIAELLFSTLPPRCTECDHRVGLLPVPEKVASAGGSKESKVTSVGNDDRVNPISNCSYGDVEALSDELEEEGLVLKDVLRIKKLLDSFGDQSHSVLFESLRTLQLMRLTVPVLKATEIGKTVNGLRRYDGQQVRQLARELIGEWKTTVDEYMETMQASRDPEGAGEATPDSVTNPSAVVNVKEEEEEGLPFPPLDDCAFFTTQNIDFAGFFDGMDDDGNPRTSGESNKNNESGRRPPVVKPDVSAREEQPPKYKFVLSKEDKVQRLGKQIPVPKPSNKPLNPASEPGRPVTGNGERRVNPAHNLQNKLDKPNIPRRPVIQSEKLRSSGEDLSSEKMEASKRRLQESYQEVENAKKRRTIQVMELHDLPKPEPGQRNSLNKSGNPLRKWANPRR